MNVKNLNTFEKEVLLEWFFNYLAMEQRYDLMRELPAIYNKACGSEIVYVVHHITNEKV